MSGALAHLISDLPSLERSTIAITLVVALVAGMMLGAVFMAVTELWRDTDPRSWIVGTVVAMALAVVVTDITLIGQDTSLDARIERELASHSVSLPDHCPRPAPGLSSTLTLIVNDAELDAPPVVETCFRIKQRNGYVPMNSLVTSEARQ